ncbi:MAG: argininosuccinate synthase [Calditrichaceae bacterium]|nr:argininosuccinate synthase [Calditrichaceae bacterium]
MKKKSVVLAYSGGLDTSFCVKYLNIEKDLEVHTILVNTGGFTAEELAEVGNRSKQIGAVSHKTIDVIDEYYQKCIRFLVYGNILKNHTYPLSVSAERVFQAMAIADAALKMKADYIAHGSTGAGNDQIRFDMIFAILVPDIPVLTPIRDQKLSREQEIAYLEKNGVKMDWKKAVYSINQGLWGTSIGGKETLTSDKTLPEKAYPSQVIKDDETELELNFKQGQIKGINNNSYKNPVEAIEALNVTGSEYGIGRGVHVGDTIIGIKGRVGFEAAAPILILKAHEALEKHVLTKWQIYWKEQLANWYGMLLHEGQYLEPVMRNIESFLEDTQATVNGSVKIKLAPRRFEIIGIESENDLMNSKFGQYGEMPSDWTSDDARGFAKIMANQISIFRKVNNGKKKS